MHLNFLISFKVKALNQTQIFEKLRQKNIEVYDIKPISRFETTFSVRLKDKKAVESTLASFQAETLSLNPKSLSKFKTFFLKQWGIVAGVIVALMLEIFSSFFVFQINVNGADCVDEIKGYIQSQGVKPFSAKSAIDTKALELGLVETFPQISMASVIVKGLTVVVNIKEKESFESGQNQDIVADFNGRITEIITISGTPNVKPGDIVKCGDILVSGQSENAENGVIAKAKIVAEVWYESTHTHFDTKTQKVRTGNAITKRKVLAFGAEIFSSSQKIDFLDYEVETNKVKVNTILPLVIENTVFFETKTQTTTEKYSDVREAITSKLRQNTLQNMAKDDIIKKENVFETTDAGMTTTTYVIIAEKHIF